MDGVGVTAGAGVVEWDAIAEGFAVSEAEWLWETGIGAAVKLGAVWLGAAGDRFCLLLGA